MLHIHFKTLFNTEIIFEKLVIWAIEWMPIKILLSFIGNSLSLDAIVEFSIIRYYRRYYF